MCWSSSSSSSSGSSKQLLTAERRVRTLVWRAFFARRGLNLNALAHSFFQVESNARRGRVEAGERGEARGGSSAARWRWRCAGGPKSAIGGISRRGGSVSCENTTDRQERWIPTPPAQCGRINQEQCRAPRREREARDPACPSRSCWALPSAPRWGSTCSRFSRRGRGFATSRGWRIACARDCGCAALLRC